MGGWAQTNTTDVQVYGIEYILGFLRSIHLNQIQKLYHTLIKHQYVVICETD